MKTEETKKRKGSTIGTIKSFKTLIDNLKNLKMANEAEIELLKGMHRKIFERWQSVEMGIETNESGETTKQQTQKQERY